MADNTVTEVRPHNQVLLIAVCKRTLTDVFTRALVDEVGTAAGQRPTVPIVLDLSMVKFAPSVALGALVQLTKSFQIVGRRVVLVGVDRRLRDAIHVTRLDKLLDLHKTIDDFTSASA